jgi:uncharacterized protein YjiS (DUF1127 family)
MSFSHAPQAGACQVYAADLTKPGLLARLVAALAREWRIHRDLRVLQTLDDRALHDIGVGPGGLDYAVRHGRPTPVEVAPGSMFRDRSPSLPVSWTEWR